MSYQVPAVPPGITVYCRPSDIVTAQAAISADVAVSTDPDYGLAAMHDGDPAKPCKFEAPGPIRIVFDFGGPQRIDAFALPNHNLPAAAVCAVEMNATDAWGAPSVSVPLTVGPVHLDGHRASPWANLTTASGYSPTGYRFLSLAVPVTTGPVQIGEALAIGRLRRFTQWTQFGTTGVQIPFVESLTTEYGVQRVYRRRVSQRTFDYRILGNDADAGDLRALLEDAGGLALPWFVANDSDRHDDDGLFVRFTRETAARLVVTERWFDFNELRWSVQELSRSLPL